MPGRHFDAFEYGDRDITLTDCRMTADSEYGLSLGILTADGLAALELAERIPSGATHINDQPVADEPVAQFGGGGASGTASRTGGQRANLDAYTETQWITAQSRLAEYSF